MVSNRPQNHRSSGSFGNSNAASAILGAFGRRPRTATNSSLRLGQATDYAESTDELISSQATRSRMSLGGRTGLPRSSSSSNVNRVISADGGGERSSRLAFPSSPRPPIASQGSSASLSNANSRSVDDTNRSPMHRTDSSQGNAGGGSAIGRYLRRYSQGAGKNMSAANEAHAIAANSSNAQSSSTSGGVGSSSNNNRNNVVNYQSGSALTTSQTMPQLPMPNLTSSPLHQNQELANMEGAMAMMMDGNDNVPATTNNTASALGESSTDTASATHRIRLVPHLEATRSLHFEPIERDVVEGAVAVKIGRFTDRAPATSSGANGDASASVFGGFGSGGGFSLPAPSATTSSGGVPGARGGAIISSAGGGGRVDSGRIAFKSKVVSRGHAEMWCEANGKVSAVEKSAYTHIY
jgi:hypothetical protein